MTDYADLVARAVSFLEGEGQIDLAEAIETLVRERDEARAEAQRLKEATEGPYARQQRLKRQGEISEQAYQIVRKERDKKK